jgi:RND superfamily putative drug exporter
MSKKSSNEKRSWRVRVALALALVFVWLGFAAVGGPYFGRIDEVSSNDLSTFLPESAESTRVKEQLEKFQDSNTIPAIVAFESKKELTVKQQDAIENVSEVVNDSGLASDTVSPSIVSDDKKASYFVVPLDSEGEIEEQIADVKTKIDSTNTAVDYKFTGPAMFSQELEKAFAGIDGTLLFVALGVVFVILLIVYRSPVLPIVTLTGAVAALSAAIFVVWQLANIGIVQLNGQVQGILFILVIGAATDYALLYIARYREELTHYQSAWLATKAAWKASFEPILAAGGTVTLGLLCLLASDLGSNKALGPVGGIGIMLSVLSALTFLPAALLLFGRSAFWPLRPKFATTKPDVGYRKAHPVWTKVGDLVSKYPRKLWVGTTVLLVAACFAIPQLNAVGVSQENLVLGESEAKDGQAIIDRHFAGGSGSPAYVVVPEAEQSAVTELLDEAEGVDGVSVLTTDDEKTQAPVGYARQDVIDEIRDEITKERKEIIIDLRSEIKDKIKSQMAGLPSSIIEEAYKSAVESAEKKIPSVHELVEEANPFADTKVKVVNGDIVLAATLTEAASSVKARQTIERLRTTVQTEHPNVAFGGVSAIQLDTNNASERDLTVIIPLILGAITIVLMLLLRAIVAPIILLLTTVLSFGATIGIAALLFNNVWNFPGADPVVVIFGFVFLVALGIDYNIFLMTRVREETAKRGVRAGTLKALIVTGGVITSAGIVLASTFAALNVIPILFLAQISFIVAFGVMLDTLIVRSLLVPALTLEMGKIMWWPSKLWRKDK